MGRSFLPRSDSAVLEFAVPFSAHISSSPSEWGLSEADAAELAEALSRFAAALARATDPTTRTSVTVRGKNGERAAMVGIVRKLARRINNCPAVSEQQKLQLGLIVPERRPGPLPPPASRPVLVAMSARGPLQTMLVCDERTSTRKAKPHGIAGAEVRAAIGQKPGAGPAAWPTICITSRALFTVSFAASAAGARVTLAARWFAARGRYGPFSDAITTHIGGGFAAAA